MEVQDFGSWPLVKNPKAARVLANLEDRRLLEPFFGQEKSASQAAKEAGVELAAMLYRVRQFQELGLIRQTREEARKGRAVKYYQSTALGYRLPFAILPYEDIEALLCALDSTVRIEAMRGMARLMKEMDDWTLHIHLDEGGRVQLNIVTSEGHGQLDTLNEVNFPAVHFSWMPLELTPEQAKALQQELLDLLRRYLPHASATTRNTYWLGLVLTPKPKP